jgi:hypothetical protein
MAVKKPIRIVVAASVCVIANTSGQAAIAKPDAADGISKQQQQWKAISNAFSNGQLSILSPDGKRSTTQIASEFANR